jgi:hypothetical protein
VTSTPRLLAAMKSAVMEMRNQADVELLRFAELAQRLEHALPQDNVEEGDMRAAVALLANQGLAPTLGFGDLVLLRPEVVNAYVSAILTAARSHVEGIGCVVEADIYRAEFEIGGIHRLAHRIDEELLLRSLVQLLLERSLCFRENTGSGSLNVFPSQMSRERDISGHPSVNRFLCLYW